MRIAHTWFEENVLRPAMHAASRAAGSAKSDAVSVTRSATRNGVACVVTVGFAVNPADITRHPDATFGEEPR